MEGGWLLTGSARSSARVLTCSDSISARPAARPYSREPGPQAPVQEPDCTIARRTRPLLRGEAAMVQTESPPADCPNSVTEAGSPPKLRMLRALRPARPHFWRGSVNKKKKRRAGLTPTAAPQ